LLRRFYNGLQEGIDWGITGILGEFKVLYQMIAEVYLGEGLVGFHERLLG